MSLRGWRGLSKPLRCFRLIDTFRLRREVRNVGVDADVVESEFSEKLCWVPAAVPSFLAGAESKVSGRQVKVGVADRVGIVSDGPEGRPFDAAPASWTIGRQADPRCTWSVFV
jgi:hypothetical protein